VQRTKTFGATIPGTLLPAWLPQVPSWGTPDGVTVIVQVEYLKLKNFRDSKSQLSGSRGTSPGLVLHYVPASPAQPWKSNPETPGLWGQYPLATVDKGDQEAGRRGERSRHSVPSAGRPRGSQRGRSPCPSSTGGRTGRRMASGRRREADGPCVTQSAHGTENSGVCRKAEAFPP
jgi:hypothetical protein